jgi:hypothetical protein
MLLADVTFSIYLGASQTRPSDLRVDQPRRHNEATMRTVPWAGYPFRFEPYYGLRLTYNPPGHPQTRIALDFTHYKIYARTEAVVTQDGTWHGLIFRDVAPMRERVQSFEVTHGLNMLGLSLLQSLSSSANGAYAGGGPVMYVPHSESRVDGIAGGDVYHFSGFGFQAQAGLATCAGDHRVYAEAKYDVKPGLTVPIAQGTAQTNVHTMHELAGWDLGPCG